MALPRIFISSTYYDLKHVRKNIESFVKSFGYVPVLFESGDIPFQHKLPIDISCYKEIENSHMQILIIGGRYGSPESEMDEDELLALDENKVYEFYNSITKVEYDKAHKRGIPIYVFVEKGVLSEYETYKKNRKNTSIEFAHVDSINIFKLLDTIFGKKLGNYIKGFENIDDITNWLKLQWAGLFADFLEGERTSIEMKDLSDQIKKLGSVTNSLQEYTEAIMRKVEPDDYQVLIDKEKARNIQEISERLLVEPLIEYLCEDFGVDKTSLQVLKALGSSADLEKFLKALGLIKKQVEEVVKNNANVIYTDFSDLKIKYTSVN